MAASASDQITNICLHSTYVLWMLIYSCNYIMVGLQTLNPTHINKTSNNLQSGVDVNKTFSWPQEWNHNVSVGHKNLPCRLSRYMCKRYCCALFWCRYIIVAAICLPKVFSRTTTIGNIAWLRHGHCQSIYTCQCWQTADWTLRRPILTNYRSNP